ARLADLLHAGAREHDRQLEGLLGKHLAGHGPERAPDLEESDGARLVPACSAPRPTRAATSRAAACGAATRWAPRSTRWGWTATCSPRRTGRCATRPPTSPTTPS